VDEDDQRAGFGATGEIETRVAAAFAKCSVTGKSTTDGDITTSFSIAVEVRC